MNKNILNDFPLKNVSKNPVNNDKDETEKIENNLYFYSFIDSDTTLKLNKELINLKNELVCNAIKTNHTVAPIYLNIQSEGGFYLSALSIMDTILNLRKTVSIYTIVDGYVASGASLLSIVGTKRYIKQNSYIMIHQLESGYWGSYEGLKDNVENISRFMKTLKDIYKQYTKIPMKKLEEILKHDLWFDSAQAIEFGLADEVL